MGYAGYTPARLPPAKPTEQEAALRVVRSVDTLSVIATLLRNCAVQPKEDKFRLIKLSNKKINSVIVQVDGGVDALLKLGWEKAVGEEGDVLVLPAGRYVTMEQVRKVEEAKDRLEKANKDAARLGKKPSTNDLEKDRIRAQIEADRKERAIAGPVVQGSAAQALPTGANAVHQGKY